MAGRRDKSVILSSFERLRDVLLLPIPLLIFVTR
jgi:hypothetical protein